MAVGRGDIVNGMSHVPPEVLTEWLQIVREKIAPNFSLCPEMVTHSNTLDLSTGNFLEENEELWSRTQDRTTLTPYITKAFSLLKDANLDSCGVTSPWDFGVHVEEEYVQSISQALLNVYGKKNAWYFCRGLQELPNARPWIALEEGDRCVVSIPCTTDDRFWESMSTDDTSEEYVSKLADYFISDDGKSGDIVEILGRNGWPILLTHWQSLVTNGLFTGLRAMKLVGERVRRHLSDQVEWKSFEEILQMVLEHKEYHICPEFMHKK
jgi:hypothetical protein